MESAWQSIRALGEQWSGPVVVEKKIEWARERRLGADAKPAKKSTTTTRKAADAKPETVAQVALRERAEKIARGKAFEKGIMD